MNAPPAPAPALPAKIPVNLFEQAFHNSPAMQMVVRMADRVFVDINDSFLATFGYAREEILGRTTHDLGFWVSTSAYEAFTTELRSKGRVASYELEVRTKNGAVRTVLFWADILEFSGDAYVVAAGVDITERQKTLAELRATHERLRHSQERFSKAFRASPAMMAITRLDTGRFVSANEAFLRATGYTEAEVVGKSGTDIQLHVNDAQRDNFLRLVCADGFAREVELIVRTKAGELRTLLVSAEVTDIEGVPHLLTVGLDITERKEAETKLRESEVRLRESEARFSSAFHSSPVLMSMATLPDARFVEVNDAFLDTFGLTRAEVIGRNTLDLGLWVDVEARRRFFERILEAKSLRNWEFLAHARDGAIRTVLLSADIIEINRGPHMLTFALDITQRKQAEAEQQRALEKERELRQLKTDFVSLVSHEFRTPLEVIMSSADNLDRYHERLPTEKRRQLLRTINKSVRRMSDMMEDVLLLGRMDSNRVVFKPTEFDLAAFCQRLRDEMESATAARCPIQLEAGKLPAKARGDEIVLRHILTNLISNAVKYSAAGSAVKLGVSREKTAAVFRIEDHGCGIPTADQPRLYQAFHRGGNVRHIQGTGLGLVIVQRCVTLHGGRIEFTSTEGQGTTFTVSLPLFGRKT